jgi:excinuclease ABC subunit B
MSFQLTSEFKPTGDQPEAIKQLVEGLKRGDEAQTLLGVTGSGKTFTIANVIQQINRPALVLSHNKTLAAQLYGEFKQFFPNNAVEYFVSYYDYYQPEAYIPVTNTYIEKDLSINDEIEFKLVNSLYSRTEVDFFRGNFRVKGDTVDVFPAYANYCYRIFFFGDEIESIEKFDPVNGTKIEDLDSIIIFPANIFVTSHDKMKKSINVIQDDLVKQIAYFKENSKNLEAKRLEDRVTYDIEMMRELGYCSGIENYSRYFDRRLPGSRPFCLLDYFPDDFILIVDESHVTISQVRAMYGGDRSRKQNLVEYGFRLPSAMDNRPLKFDEFEAMTGQAIYVSATPADYELKKSEGIVVEQLIRPTGLLDPVIEVRPSLNQIDELLEEINTVVNKNERVLVTTLTKRMAEELTKYLSNINIKCRYIHSDVDTIERVEIMRDLRLGAFDVLVGVNLLREGLDLPEVSLVATAGRAARNINSKVIMFADKITSSMQKTIDETNRKREKQIAYNIKHNITPSSINKSTEAILGQTVVADTKNIISVPYIENEKINVAADPVIKYMTANQLKKAIAKSKKEIEKAAKELNFIEAARLRDELIELENLLTNKCR